jgi:hypothetical protein
MALNPFDLKEAWRNFTPKEFELIGEFERPQQPMDADRGAYAEPGYLPSTRLLPLKARRAARPVRQSRTARII